MKTTISSSGTRTSNAAAGGSRGRNRSWRRFIPWAIGSGLLLMIIAGLRPKPTEVEVATVSYGPMSVSVLEEGKTRIRHRYIISPPVAGYLNRVPLRAGDRIEAGKTVLATVQPQPASFLDPRTRAEAEARLQAAEAAKMQRETQVERARSALELATKDLERARQLQKTGAIAAQEFDAAVNRVDILTRELNAAEFARRVGEFEVVQARATLTEAENPSQSAREPLQIIAPINGYVLNVFEESARTVTAGMQIMEVGDPTDLEAEIELLSRDAAGVKVGATVSIEQWGGDRPLQGRVTVVEPGGFTKISALGVEEQRVKVRVDFTEPIPEGYNLGDRYRVEARIVTWHSDRVLQVPTGSLFRRGNDWMTFLADGGKARLSKVTIDHNNGTVAEVIDGLSEGEIVILHPPDTVTDGAAIRRRE